MKKKKILQVIGTLRTGGAEIVAVNYYKYADKNKYSHDFLVYGEEIGELEKVVETMGGKILRVPSPKNNYIKFYKAVLKIIRTNAYDIVHSHTLFNSGFIMKAASKANVSIRISHAHSARFNKKVSPMKKIYNGLMRRYINKYSTKLVACSGDAGNYLFTEPVFNKKGIIINNGIQLAKYKFNINLRNQVRENLNIEDDYCIGHVGRLSEVKNHSYILEVFSELLKKHDKSKLILVGDGELRDSLQYKAEQLAISSHVIFLGNRNDVSELLQAFDAYIFPSYYEGLGISIIEAQATGLKCFISDTIPKDVDITNLIERHSIELPPKVWAEKLIKFNNLKIKRTGILNEKIDSYDINNVMETLNKLYNDC